MSDVVVNPATGSLLVSYDPDDPIDLLIEDLRTVGLETARLIEESRRHRTQSTGAAVVRLLAGTANEKLHEATKGHFDLRLAVPAAYMLLAVRNFMHHRARLRDASWYQLLYWAFDSFFKLHEEQNLRDLTSSNGRVVT